MTSFAMHGPFRRYWLAETSTVLAYQMLVIAVGWQVYDLTSSALSLGLIGLVQFTPYFLFTLLAGHVADRYDRKKVAVICQITQCIIAGCLAYGSYTHTISSKLIYLCAFSLGTSTAFQSPSLRSMLPSLVERSMLPRCLAWSGGARKVAIVTGPVLGGFIYLLGPAAVYATSATMFIVAGYMITRIRLPAAQRVREPVTLESLFGGVAHIRSSPILLGAMTLDLFATLLGGATALLPIYARDILMTGPTGLGMLRAAPAMGALLTSIVLVRAPLTARVGRKMFASLAVFGCAIVVFGVSQSFALSMAALVLSGSADMVGVVIRSSLVQLETPDNRRGRVTAVNALFNNTANQLGQFESGLTAAWFGTVPAVVIGGVGTVIVVVLWMRLFPALLNRETLVTHGS